MNTKDKKCHLVRMTTLMTVKKSRSSIQRVDSIVRTRMALRLEFGAQRSMSRKNIFNWRATHTQATTPSPPRIIFSTPSTISD